MMPIRALRMRKAAAGGASISLGNTYNLDSSGGRPSDVTEGSVYLAAASGTVNNLSISQLPGGSSTGQFRLVIYAASNGTTVGAKLGETAVDTAIGTGATKTLALLSPVSIVSGQKYFIGVQWGGPGTNSCGCNTQGLSGITLTSISGLLRWSDTFSDGALANAGSITAFGGSDFAVWATT